MAQEHSKRPTIWAALDSLFALACWAIIWVALWALRSKSPTAP